MQAGKKGNSAHRTKLYGCPVIFLFLNPGGQSKIARKTAGGGNSGDFTLTPPVSVHFPER